MTRISQASALSRVPGNLSFLASTMFRRSACVALALAASFAACGCLPETPDAATSQSSVSTAVTTEIDPGEPSRESAIARYFQHLSRPRQAGDSIALRHPAFHDVAGASGITHQYESGASGLLLMVEPVGGGCGWIDFDRDGLWDLYLNQAGDPAALSLVSRPSDQLFRNLGGEQFAAVTGPSGIDEQGYSQGVAIGDFDNDGFDDIFITNVGPDTLYRNQGDGTFVDVTAATIGHDTLWGISAAWGDIDLDGDLDLYVCNYVDFDPYHPQVCRNASGAKIMCQPNQVAPVPDECFLNGGDGTFHPVARERGLFGIGNRAMGVVIADLTNDGWPDIFVANDATANFLFINQRNGNFLEQAQLLGCAVAADGRAQANMGIALGDYDHNGWLDLYVTHFEGEWNTLFRNRGPEGFEDVSASVGLVPPKLSLVGFGAVMHDFNQDGREELFIANGHLDDPGHLGVPLEMPPQCFTYDGRRWHEVSDRAGDYFRERFVGRGVATADFDNDGDVDLAVVHQNQPMALLRNDSQRGHWLKIEFIGRRSNRNAIGVRATVRQGPQILLQELAGGTSYCAAHQPILVYGLGPSAEECDVEIRWPDGAVQVLEAIGVDQTLRLLEPLGSGGMP